MSIHAKNKKILAGILCLSITAGQANAINWGSIGSAIGSAATSFLNPIKSKTGDTQNFVLKQLAICAVISIIPILKLIQHNTYSQKENNLGHCGNSDHYKDKMLKHTKKIVRNSAVYATAITTLNVPGLYKLLPIIICAGGFFIYKNGENITSKFWEIVKRCKKSVKQCKKSVIQWYEDRKRQKEEQEAEKKTQELNKKLIKCIETGVVGVGADAANAIEGAAVAIKVDDLIKEGADANVTIDNDEKEITIVSAYSQSEDNTNIKINVGKNQRILSKALLAEKINVHLIDILTSNDRAKLRYEDILYIKNKGKEKVLLDLKTVKDSNVDGFLYINKDDQLKFISLTVKDVLEFEGLKSKEEKTKFIKEKEELIVKANLLLLNKEK